MFKKTLASLGLLATLLPTSHALAAMPNPPVPDCWNNPDAVPRSYIVGIDRAKLGSAKTLRALEAFSHTLYVHAKSYPMFFDRAVYVDVEAPLGQWGDAGRPMTEAELRVAVEGELAKLSKDFALTIECNGYAYPQKR